MMILGFQVEAQNTELQICSTPWVAFRASDTWSLFRVVGQKPKHRFHSRERDKHRLIYFFNFFDFGEFIPKLTDIRIPPAKGLLKR